ncbi:hypothetical protein ACVIGB_000400 [Bradyrhizobium sp. USDA 4341]
MKTRRIVQGLILLAAGVVFGVVGLLIIHTAKDQTRLAEQSFQRAEDTCRDSANSLVRSVGGQGLIKEVKDGETWEISLRSIGDKRMALADSSTVVTACPTRALEYYCLGPACGPQDNRPIHAGRQNSALIMRLTLRPEVPLERVAKLNAPAATSATPAPNLPPDAAQPKLAPRPPQPVKPPAQNVRPPLPQQQPRTIGSPAALNGVISQ